MKANALRTVKRPAEERGQADHGWLQSRFTFSFAEYFDPDHMGFRSLRVMNDDTIQPGGGFGKHPHDNMEIFTYVLEGELEHKDSLGNGAVIQAGNLQYMSAGSGVYHSEFNPSATDKTVLYQIWLQPNERDGEPHYAEIPLGNRTPANVLALLFSGAGRDDSTAIRQDAEIYFSRLEKGLDITSAPSPSRPHTWIQVLQGEVDLQHERLTTGDGLALENAPGEISIHASEDSQILLFRLS